MKAIIYISVMLMSLLSCKAQQIEQAEIYGAFYKLQKGKDYNIAYTLELKNDSTFFLHLNTAGGNPQCEGKWEILDGNFIFLKCNEITDVAETLTNGYMSQREHKVEIISKNKIKYKDAPLVLV
jgi:hypothetical protein